MSKNEGKHPRGYWMGVGLSIGIAAGIAIGLGMGTAMEERNKNNLRSLTEQEKTRQKRSITVGLALVSLMTVILIMIYFLLAR